MIQRTGQMLPRQMPQTAKVCKIRLYTKSKLLKVCRSQKKDVLRVGGWVAGGSWLRIMPRCGSILQAETCEILSLAENPTWSQVWQ